LNDGSRYEHHHTQGEPAQDTHLGAHRTRTHCKLSGVTQLGSDQCAGGPAEHRAGDQEAHPEEEAGRRALDRAGGAHL
jgi:hypothetical protein